MPKKKTKNTEYGASDIYVLEGLAPVRRRPGMYIGSTGTQGLHHLIFECCDNCIDEFIMGHGNKMEIVLLPDNRVEVSDNGRGIPVDVHKQTKKSALETVMTHLHAGGKFGGKVYKATGGLHGVGVSVVCALSKWMKAEVCRDGKKYEQEYSRGKPKSKVKKVGTCKQRGTKITFEPDPEIFKTLEFSWKKILRHLREQAYLVPGLKIRLQDKRERPYKKYNFYFEGGIKSLLDYLMEGERKIQERPFFIQKDVDDMKVEVAFAYNDGMDTEEVCYANNIPTPEGGNHLTGFRSALTRALQSWGKNKKLLNNDKEKIEGEDVREGLTAVVSIKLPDPQFEGQTKQKLGNPEARSAVESAVCDLLPDLLEKQPRDGRAIINKCILASKSRKAAKAAKEAVLRKGIIEGLTLPGKLTDCSSRDPEDSELFIVEGESAGGCFSGDTKVALADGRNLTFKELIKEDKKAKKNYCYTIKENGKIGIGLIQDPRKTRRNEKVIKIILDNNEEIVCTPDHLFMLKNGSYKKAKNLTPKDSLMPLYKKHSKIKGKIKIEGGERKLEYAVSNYNHKIKKIVKLKKTIDVYDLEVKNTHNFALSSGIFVHNSSRQGRDRRFQAILPLRGKILNVERVHLNRILSSQEIKSLIISLGTAIADDFNIDKLRYHKIVLMSDADTDGAHIRTLLLTLFYRYFREIIEKGHVYVAQPPLYRIQIGKQIEYAYTEKEKEGILLKIKRQSSFYSALQRAWRNEPRSALGNNHGSREKNLKAD